MLFAEYNVYSPYPPAPFPEGEGGKCRALLTGYSVQYAVIAEMQSAKDTV